MSHLASKVGDLDLLLAVKQAEATKLQEDVREMEITTDSAKQEAKMNSDASLALQDTLRRANAEKKQVEIKLRESCDGMTDSKVQLHKLQTMNDSLQTGECGGFVNNTWTALRICLMHTLFASH